MSVNRAALAAALAALVACSSQEGESAPAPPQPASLTVTIPSLEVAIPKCAAPFAQLESGGVDVGCGLGCPTGGSTCTLICPEHLGLMSATAYQLSVVYLQSSVPVARASIGEVRLSPGANQLSVGVGSVAATDLQKLCP